MSKERVREVVFNNEKIHDIAMDIIHWGIKQFIEGSHPTDALNYVYGMVDALNKFVQLADADLDIRDMFENVKSHIDFLEHASEIAPPKGYTELTEDDEDEVIRVTVN